MAKWRRIILNKLSQWGIPTSFLGKYIDDCTNVMRLLRVGIIWDRESNQLRICLDKRKDDVERGDR